MNEECRIFFSGNSMNPTLKTGDRLKVGPVKFSDVKIGDIVVFGPKNPTCHRVIGKYRARGQDYFLEKGDNRACGTVNNVSFEKILGRVNEIETSRGMVLCPEKTISKIGVVRLSILSFIFGACHCIKILLFGTRRNVFTRRIKFLFSRFFR